LGVHRGLPRMLLWMLNGDAGVKMSVRVER